MFFGIHRGLTIDTYNYRNGSFIGKSKLLESSEPVLYFDQYHFVKDNKLFIRDFTPLATSLIQSVNDQNVSKPQVIDFSKGKRINSEPRIEVLPEPAKKPNDKPQIPSKSENKVRNGLFSGSFLKKVAIIALVILGLIGLRYFKYSPLSQLR